MAYFGAGPSKIPQPVLEEVQREMLDYGGTGISVMEISHRSPTFSNIIQTAEADLRSLLCIPDSYAVVFMQGGATGQFAAVPLNLKVNAKADYFVTGTWSKKAAAEARQFLDVKVICDLADSVPDKETLTFRQDADYVYYCDNETIGGVEFGYLPETGDIPLVVDISSNILTRSIDISKCAVLVAGAQKNMGPAGVTVVVVRKDLLSRSASGCPSMFSYSAMHKAASVFNTPPCFNIYVVGKVLSWVLKEGGVTEMQRRSAVKSQLLYKTVDQSNGFYVCPVGTESRSRTTARIRCSEGEEVEKRFLKQAEEHGFKALKGHRSVGGIRVAMFNAISIQQIEALVDFMRDFAKETLSA